MALRIWWFFLGGVLGGLGGGGGGFAGFGFRVRVAVVRKGLSFHGFLIRLDTYIYEPDTFRVYLASLIYIQYKLPS